MSWGQHRPPYDLLDFLDGCGFEGDNGRSGSSLSLRNFSTDLGDALALPSPVTLSLGFGLAENDEVGFPPTNVFLK